MLVYALNSCRSGQAWPAPAHNNRMSDGIRDAPDLLPPATTSGAVVDPVVSRAKARSTCDVEGQLSGSERENALTSWENWTYLRTRVEIHLSSDVGTATFYKV